MEQVYNHFTRFRSFQRDEDGATTVDWVVLTATVVFLGMGVTFVVNANIPGLAHKTSSVVANQPLGD